MGKSKTNYSTWEYPTELLNLMRQRIQALQNSRAIYSDVNLLQHGDFRGVAIDALIIDRDIPSFYQTLDLVEQRIAGRTGQAKDQHEHLEIIDIVMHLDIISTDFDMIIMPSYMSLTHELNKMHHTMSGGAHVTG